MTRENDVYSVLIMQSSLLTLSPVASFSRCLLVNKRMCNTMSDDVIFHEKGLFSRKNYRILPVAQSFQISFFYVTVQQERIPRRQKTWKSAPLVPQVCTMGNTNTKNESRHIKKLPDSCIRGFSYPINQKKYN